MQSNILLLLPEGSHQTEPIVPVGVRRLIVQIASEQPAIQAVVAIAAFSNSPIIYLNTEQ